MTPEQRKAARDLLERLTEVMDDSADFYHGKPVSEFSDALRLLFKQIDDDKGLLRQVLRLLERREFYETRFPRGVAALLDALRARLGDVANPPAPLLAAGGKPEQG